MGKNGYRETTQPGDGTLLWYGMALRDHDLDIIKMRKCILSYDFFGTKREVILDECVVFCFCLYNA